MSHICRPAKEGTVFLRQSRHSAVLPVVDDAAVEQGALNQRSPELVLQVSLGWHCGAGGGSAMAQGQLCPCQQQTLFSPT